jgi:hypothetical protein
MVLTHPLCDWLHLSIPRFFHTRNASQSLCVFPLCTPTTTPPDAKAPPRNPSAFDSFSLAPHPAPRPGPGGAPLGLSHGEPPPDTGGLRAAAGLGGASHIWKEVMSGDNLVDLDHEDEEEVGLRFC